MLVPVFPLRMQQPMCNLLETLVTQKCAARHQERRDHPWHGRAEHKRERDDVGPRSAHCIPATLQFSEFHVLDTGCDYPDVPKRIFKTPGTVTIKLLGDRDEQFGARVDRGAHGSVGVCDVHVQLAR